MRLHDALLALITITSLLPTLIVPLPQNDWNSNKGLTLSADTIASLNPDVAQGTKPKCPGSSGTDSRS